eukprot:Em0001g1622a
MDRVISAMKNKVHHRSAVVLFQWEKHSNQECKHVALLHPDPYIQSTLTIKNILHQVEAGKQPNLLNSLDLELVFYHTEVDQSRYSLYSQELQRLHQYIVELQEAKQSESVLQQLATYMAVLIGESNPLTADLLHQSANTSKIVKQLEFMEFFQTNFPKGTIPIKMHMVEDHAVQWARSTHVGFGLLGEQGVESIHAKFNYLARAYSAIKGKGNNPELLTSFRMSDWSIFVNGFDGKSIIVAISGPRPENTKVKDFKAKVKEKTGVDIPYQRLLYSGKDLEDEKCLSDYPPLGNQSQVQLVSRLLGGTSRVVDPSIRRSKGPCMLTFTEYDTPECVILPCNHIIHPDELMATCQNEVFDNRKWEIRCFQPGCSTEWPLSFVAKCGATRKELELLEKGLSENHCNLNPAADIRQCPGCHSYCERVDPSNARARCWQCTKKTGKAYDFCWDCFGQWIGDHKCPIAGVIKTLSSAPEKDINGVKCPSIRACPKCNSLIEHKDRCKHMVCNLLSCKQEFCFVCLRPKVSGSWQCGAFNTKCDTAPRQKRLSTR